MFFSLTNTTSKSNLWFKTRIKKVAKISVIRYVPHSTELRLDTYIKEQYKMTLKSACFLLIKKAVISSNMSGEFIITFPTKKLDDLASLITYGTGLIKGSFILQEAFKRYKKE